MGQVTSTYDLLARIEQGDEYAFTALFEKYQKRLALLIYYKLSREMRRLADAEDVLQETFLEAFRAIRLRAGLVASEEVGRQILPLFHHSLRRILHP
jgi:DNA-directed RNA polymerase specialized sigma24 family protein